MGSGTATSAASACREPAFGSTTTAASYALYAASRRKALSPTLARSRRTRRLHKQSAGNASPWQSSSLSKRPTRTLSGGRVLAGLGPAARVFEVLTARLAVYSTDLADHARGGQGYRRGSYRLWKTKLVSPTCFWPLVRAL